MKDGDEVVNGGGGGEESDGVRKKRRVGEKEVKTSGSELRLAIEELSVVGCIKDENIEKKSVPTAAFLSVSNLLLLLLGLFALSLRSIDGSYCFFLQIWDLGIYPNSCSSILSDKVGPTMAVMRKDIQTNMERLEDTYVSNPSLYSNLVDILKRETDEGIAKKRSSCSRAVVWLSRSMDFGLTVMERLMKDSGLSLEEAVEEAYSSKLKPWHGWISSAAYKVALRLIPNRNEFTELLMGNERDYNLLKDEIQLLCSLIQPLLNEINTHLRVLELEKLRSN